MAKKTKREKILAEYHRKLRLLDAGGVAKTPKETASVNPATSVKSVTYRLNFPGERPSGRAVSSSLPVLGNFSYVVSDLKRILFLTGLAICAQLVLWYALKGK